MRVSFRSGTELSPALWAQVSVLVVDDNVTMRRIVRSILSGFGIRHVLEAENGAAGFDTFLMAGPDIVITDLQMPVMDGLRLTSLLRKEGWSRDPFVPVLMMSVHTERSRIAQMWRAGVTDILAKPFSAATLHQRLVTAIVASPDFIECGNYFGPDRRSMGDTRVGTKARVMRPRPPLERIVARSGADGLILSSQPAPHAQWNRPVVARQAI